MLTTTPTTIMATCSSNSSWPDHQQVVSSVSKRERVIKELVQGKDFATQLQQQILLQYQKPPAATAADHTTSDLVVKILASFTHGLSLLSSEEPEVSQNLTTSQVVDSDYCTSTKRSPASSKEKRGCYKRKKISDSWVVLSATLEDGHAWRKYGQKDILNAKYPRSYFRCTRKYDQGCRATKQVQKMEENPQMYHNTYIGHHTCRDILHDSSLLVCEPNWEFCNNNNNRMFGNSNCSKNIISPLQKQSNSTTNSTSSLVGVKQECLSSKEETATPATSELITDNVSGLDDDDEAMMWKEFMPTEDGYGGVYSHTDQATSQCLGLDLDFDNDFRFDDGWN